MKYTKLLLLAGVALIGLSGCASSEKSLTIESQSEINKPSVDSENEFVFRENTQKFYSDAKATKIWVATYKTKSNIRVRSHFIDVWVKQAQFDGLNTS